MKSRNNNLTDQTIEFWKPRYTEELSLEDARQIVRNTTDFFKVLIEWDHCAGSQPESLQDSAHLICSGDPEGPSCS